MARSKAAWAAVGALRSRGGSYRGGSKRAICTSSASRAGLGVGAEGEAAGALEGAETT
jgi:hypothetical protein